MSADQAQGALSLPVFFGLLAFIAAAVLVGLHVLAWWEKRRDPSRSGESLLALTRRKDRL